MNATNDELNWLAYRYVAGELTEDEEERFEQRLADDQAAREAVEQAAELSDAIRLAAAEAPSVPDRRTLNVARGATWAAATVAGLLFVAFVCWRSLSDSPSETKSAGADTETSDQPRVAAKDSDDEDAFTALAWARLRGADAIEPAEFEEEPWNQVESELAGTNLVVGERVNGELPVWLRTAIASENESQEGER